jgi:hypothetical protein
MTKQSNGDYSIHHKDNLFFLVPESTEKIFLSTQGSAKHMKMGGYEYYGANHKLMIFFAVKRR